jgi:hypothetical protein
LRHQLSSLAANSSYPVPKILPSTFVAVVAPMALGHTQEKKYPILGYLDKMDRIHPSFPKMRRIYPSYSYFSHWDIRIYPKIVFMYIREYLIVRILSKFLRKWRFRNFLPPYASR